MFDPGTTSVERPRPLVVPRGLVVLAALWVFFAWILIFGWKPPIQPQAASYGSSIQLLFTIVGLGTSVAWPLARLSARPSSAPRLQALFDAVAILVLLQVVVWPLRLVTNWTLPRAIALDLSLAASVAITAALLAASQGSRRPRLRTIAMGAAVALAILPPLVARVTGSDTEAFLPLAVSGPALLGRLAAPVPLDPGPVEHALIEAAVAAAAAGWCVVAILAIRARSSRGAAGHDGVDS